MTEERKDAKAPAFCNYEGSAYRTDFWEGQGRDYEDRAERVALRAMLPPTGRRIVDLGAGFGRLVDLYDGYEQVVLLDYSRSLLEEARERLGDDARYVYVAGNLYNLPFADGALDTAVLVRVIHHLAEPGVAVSEIGRILAAGRTFVLEYANKRNIKAVLRYLLGRQGDNPFSREPYEFVPLNLNFHPKHVDQMLDAADLVTRAQRAVSTFRVGWLKRNLPTGLLVGADRLLQVPTAPLKLAPSAFVRAEKAGARSELNPALFRCPACHGQEMVGAGDALACPVCGARWSTAGGIHDFREPLADDLA